MTGTEFTIFDDGIAASAAVDSRLFPVHVRRQCGLIAYEHNIFGTAPREFEVVVPKLCVGF